jgi:hypothetical protein
VTTVIEEDHLQRLLECVDRVQELAHCRCLQDHLCEYCAAKQVIRRIIEEELGG